MRLEILWFAHRLILPRKLPTIATGTCSASVSLMKETCMSRGRWRVVLIWISNLCFHGTGIWGKLKRRYSIWEGSLRIKTNSTRSTTVGLTITTWWRRRLSQRSTERTSCNKSWLRYQCHQNQGITLRSCKVLERGYKAWPSNCPSTKQR